MASDFKACFPPAGEKGGLGCVVYQINQTWDTKTERNVLICKVWSENSAYIIYTPVSEYVCTINSIHICTFLCTNPHCWISGGYMSLRSDWPLPMPKTAKIKSTGWCWQLHKSWSANLYSQQHFCAWEIRSIFFFSLHAKPHLHL